MDSTEKHATAIALDPLTRPMHILHVGLAVSSSMNITLIVSFTIIHSKTGALDVLTSDQSSKVPHKNSDYISASHPWSIFIKPLLLRYRLRMIRYFLSI